MSSVLVGASALLFVAGASCAKGVAGDAVGSDGAVTGESGGGGGGGGGGGDDGATTGDDAASGGDADLGNATPAQAGDVVLSEIMFDPSGPEPQQEWVEVYNTTPGAKSLDGVSIVDNGGRSTALDATAIVPAMGYVILVHDHTGAVSASLPGAASAAEYGSDGGGPLLANSTQATIALVRGSTTLVSVPFGGFGIGSSGASIQLKTLSVAGASSKTNWCESLHPWPGGGDKGTPAAANDCP